MLEAATGEPLERLVRQRIIRPLGLARTSFRTGPSIAGYHSHGYLPPSLTGAGYVDVTRLSPSIAWAAGGMVSAAGDLRRFYEALLGGQLLRPAQLAQMLTTVPVLPVFGYGLGIYSLRTACGTVWGHDGGIPGYVNVTYNDRSASAVSWSCFPPNPTRLWIRFSSSRSTRRCARCSAGCHPVLRVLPRWGRWTSHLSASRDEVASPARCTAAPPVGTATPRATFPPDCAPPAYLIHHFFAARSG
jgi:CubicO group peptidase (beta-lactamase class C family)